MENLHLTGLDNAKIKQTTDQLNQLLSDLQVYYQNLRGFHWNIQGREFFDLHQKFEELYTETATQIDEVAERILTLDATPYHSYEDFLVNAKIKSKTNISAAQLAVETIVENLSVLVAVEKRILITTNDSGDEGTATLISDMIKLHEKTSWMFRAWLK